MTAANETPTSPPSKRVKTDDNTGADAGVSSSAAAPALQVKKLSDKAKVPTRGSAFAAGYDIYAAKDTTVPARGKVLVDTDISIAVPAGTCTFPLPFPFHTLPPLSLVPSTASWRGREEGNQ